jgi:hypothetical protein
MFTMQHKGFNAKIMRAQRLTGLGTHELPLGTPIETLPVDEFKEPLSHWIKGAGNYVVPVDSDWGLWFDFTLNDRMNTAVLLSIKGMNPVTGQRTNGLGLERYEEKCPIHDVKFKDGLFCEKCNYKWPYQNYISHPNVLWWDGFRSSDGKVRQFFFTEDMAKSVPELVIGKEDTVPAFGFAFFRPKVTRGAVGQKTRSGIISSYNEIKYCKSSAPSHKFLGSGSNLESLNEQKTSDIKNISDSMMSLCCDSLSELPQVACAVACAAAPVEYVETLSFIQERCVEKKSRSKNAEVGVGAGAEISQSLQIDPLKVNDWENEPASVMRLYFVFIEQFEEIKSKGLVDLIGQKEGYLSGLPVG